MKLMIACLVVLLTLSQRTDAAFELALDMVPGGGIDSNIDVMTGAPVQVDVYLIQTGSDSLSGYSFGVAFNNADLTFNSASGHNVPAGLSGFSSPTLMNGLTYTAASFPVAGLADNTHFLGSLNFTADLTYFNVTNLSFTSVGVSREVAGVSTAVPMSDITLNGGSVSAVPEPSSLAVLGLTAGGLLVRRRRKA